MSGSYPPTPGGGGNMGSYGHGYYPQYSGYATPATPTGMGPPYGYGAYPAAHGHAPGQFMPGHPNFQHGMHPGYYPEEGGGDDEDDGDEDEDGAMDDDEEDIDMEMPLDGQSAERAMKHMIYTQLFAEGFSGGQASAVDQLLKEVVGYMQELYVTTQEYGTQAGRSAPNVQDFVAACEEMEIAPKMLQPKRQFVPPAILKRAGADDLKAKIKKRRKQRRKRSHNARHANLIPRDLSSPEPELLPSDEYPFIPVTLRSLQPQQHMNAYKPLAQNSSSASATFPPACPPKHTYIRSAPDPPQRSSLSASLEKRMQNTAKVRTALKNLMDAADIPAREAEAAGALGPDGKPVAPRVHLTASSLVNWQETFTTTRRRWKVAK